ncbi:uncharacterized protein [Macaca nemestrina]|uniref:uncharacterized protein isoform X1 n=1 Tax=Macaca nemestrina TaxID=9545 RepID=UPI0039B95792
MLRSSGLKLSQKYFVTRRIKTFMGCLNIFIIDLHQELLKDFSSSFKCNLAATTTCDKLQNTEYRILEATVREQDGERQKPNSRICWVLPNCNWNLAPRPTPLLPPQLWGLGRKEPQRVRTTALTDPRAGLHSVNLTKGTSRADMFCLHFLC